MPHDIAVFASIAATIVFSVAGVALVGVRVHTYWCRAVRPTAGAGRSEPDRLARLEQAMDAVALDVERIAEGQRFLTSALAKATPALADRFEQYEERSRPPTGAQRTASNDAARSIA